jgi:hypothetical protein
MKTLLFLALAITLIAAEPPAPKEDFSVKQLEPAKVAALQAASDKLTAAIAAFEKAQAALHSAQEEREKLVGQINDQFGAYAGDCSLSSNASAWANYRKVKTVEVRGAYALISERVEACPTNSLAVLTGTADKYLTYSSSDWSDSTLPAKKNSGGSSSTVPLK